MDVFFESKQLAEVCSQRKALVRAFGIERAKKIERRLQQLTAAGVLDDLRSAPGRCHELTADRGGQLSLDLDHPQRLIFRPTKQPPPSKSDGGLDWTTVESVTIIEIADTHE